MSGGSFFHMSHGTIQTGPTVSTLPPIPTGSIVYLPSLSSVLSTEPQMVLN